MPSGPCYAGVEIVNVPPVLSVPCKCNPLSGDFPDHGFGIIFSRAIVHHLDLHDGGPGILVQNAAQRALQGVRANICRDHHRPTWAIGRVTYTRPRWTL